MESCSSIKSRPPEDQSPFRFHPIDEPDTAVAAERVFRPKMVPVQLRDVFSVSSNPSETPRLTTPLQPKFSVATSVTFDDDDASYDKSLQSLSDHGRTASTSLKRSMCHTDGTASQPMRIKRICRCDDTTEEQKEQRARNLLWKQSLKRSLFRSIPT